MACRSGLAFKGLESALRESAASSTLGRIERWMPGRAILLVVSVMVGDLLEWSIDTRGMRGRRDFWNSKLTSLGRVGMGLICNFVEEDEDDKVGNNVGHIAILGDEKADLGELTVEPALTTEGFVDLLLVVVLRVLLMFMVVFMLDLLTVLLLVLLAFCVALRLALEWKRKWILWYLQNFPNFGALLMTFFNHTIAEGHRVVIAKKMTPSAVFCAKYEILGYERSIIGHHYGVCMRCVVCGYLVNFAILQVQLQLNGH
jgi:hypothetical protein